MFQKSLLLLQPAKKSKDLNKVSLLLQDLGPINVLAFLQKKIFLDTKILVPTLALSLIRIFNFSMDLGVEDNMEDSVIWTSAMFFSKDFMRVLGLIKDIMGGLKNKILIRDQEGRQNEIFFCIWFMFYINVWRSQNS